MTKRETWRTRTGTNRHPRTFIIIEKSSFDIKLKITNSLLQKTKKVKIEIENEKLKFFQLPSIEIKDTIFIQNCQNDKIRIYFSWFYSQEFV